MVAPLLEKIQEVTEPLQPIIDIVTTPLPVLSDLGLEITLLDIAKATGKVSPGFITAMETIFDVISIVNSIDLSDPARCSCRSATSRSIPAGKTVIRRSPTSVILARPTSTSQALPTMLLDPDGAFAHCISGLPDGLQDILGEVGGVAAKSWPAWPKIRRGRHHPETEAILVPHPGRPVAGVRHADGQGGGAGRLRHAQFKVDAEFSAFFSIFGPLGVSINLEAALNIDFAFGYDTKGFKDFAASDFRNPLLLANGLYVSDDPTDPLTRAAGTTRPNSPSTAVCGPRPN